MKHNATPTVTPTAGYTFPWQQSFAPSQPQQYGIPTPIPPTNNGDTSLKPFAKINAIVRKPLAKIIIATQQARL